MHQLILLSFFLTCFVSYSVLTVSVTDNSLNEKWSLFKKQHNKIYENSKDELKRRIIWESNLKYINSHNIEAKKGVHTFSLKMNRFGDWTREEFSRKMNGFKMNINSKHQKKAVKGCVNLENVKAPDSIDWRDKGYVTPIKDQGNCGSCWAFSAVASLEGQHFKQSGQLVSLSEQNLVDCSRKYGNMGCEGGLMDQAFSYIKDNKGIDTETSYPYEAKDDQCRFDPNNIGATDKGFSDITSGDEDELTTALGVVGPISVAIDASQSSFQFYSSGIYSDKQCSSTSLDHGVTAVGYGSLGPQQDYYIIKNSWGTSWGDSGYMLLAKNQSNMCGVATMASFPVVYC